MDLADTAHHIVWDLDGTLVDSRSDLVAAVNEALRTISCPGLPASVVLSFVGDGVAALVRRAVRESHAPAAAEVPALEALEAYYFDHCLENTMLYPGIAEVLDKLLEAGHELSVLTNKKEVFTRRILEGLGHADTFSRVVGGDSGWGLKPNPAGLRWLLGQSSIAPRNTWMVGDSGVDIATAISAGTRAAAVSWGFNSPAALRAAGASISLGSPGEILQLLGLGASATSSTSPISDAKVKSI
ncbi:MAG: HAD hydrolase-like protein [Candidatus Binatia bacterium]|nr:HAD hydrolase-like protein [Candidatus Binatia bacterium]